MVRFVLEVGHNSKEPSRISFNTRVEDEEGSVREFNSCREIFTQINEIVDSNRDEDLKPQFEIYVIIKRIDVRHVKVSTDYSQVPNSGFNSFIIRTGMGLYEVIKKACSGKVLLARKKAPSAQNG